MEGRLTFKMQGEISFLQSSCDPLDHALGIAKALPHFSCIKMLLSEATVEGGGAEALYTLHI